MLEDTFEGLEDQEEMEEEAEAEIDKILFEITAGEFVGAAESQVYALFNEMQQLKSSSILCFPSGISSFWWAESSDRLIPQGILAEKASGAQQGRTNIHQLLSVQLCNWGSIRSVFGCAVNPLNKVKLTWLARCCY